MHTKIICLHHCPLRLAASALAALMRAHCNPCQLHVASANGGIAHLFCASLASATLRILRSSCSNTCSSAKRSEVTDLATEDPLAAATGGAIGWVEYPKMGLPSIGGRWRGALSSRKLGGKSVI